MIDHAKWFHLSGKFLTENLPVEVREVVSMDEKLPFCEACIVSRT